MKPDARRVWIAQCLCPQRHAILAATNEADDRSEAEATLIAQLRTHVRRMIGSGTINPWCGLCKAPVESWRYELGRTPYRSIEEAEPSLRQSERAQAAVREAFGDRDHPPLDPTYG
jgi:hypothetical protein